MSHDATERARATPGPRLAERLVFLNIADRARPGTGRAWPSVATIAAEEGLGKRTVVRALRRLRDRGLIIVEHHAMASGPATVVSRTRTSSLRS